MKESKNLKIVFFGTPDFVTPILRTLDAHFNLVGVVTTPDTIQGRKKLLTPTPVKQYVLDHTLPIPVFTPENLDNKTLEQLTKLSPDLFVVAAYGKIIPQSFLDIPQYGSLNVHPSLLPKYRGPSPIQTTILNGDEKIGVTIIKMDEQVDHGPILAQWEMPVNAEDTFASLHSVLFEKAGSELPSLIPSFVDGTIVPRAQDENKATYCARITRESGYVALDRPPTPEVLDRMIRAYYPWPTAWTRMNGKIVKFLPEKKLQMEGKKPVSLKEFLNGYPDLRGTIEKLFGN